MLLKLPIIPSKHHHVTLYYNFYCINIYNVHAEYYNGELSVSSVDLYIVAFMFTIITFLNNLRDYFITSGHCSP